MHSDVKLENIVTGYWPNGSPEVCARVVDLAATIRCGQCMVESTASAMPPEVAAAILRAYKEGMSNREAAALVAPFMTPAFDCRTLALVLAELATGER